MGKTSGKEHLKVFISYSHDSAEHADKVLVFANKLRAEGIDAILDQYEVSPPEGWPMWMDREIRGADFVLMICTETYFKRVMGEEELGRGLGVKWEGKLIYQHIYQGDGENSRFLPVLFDGGEVGNIPTLLQDATRYYVDTKPGYEKLYRRLTNQPGVVKPGLGEVRDMPPREILAAVPRKERQPDFFGPRVYTSKLPVTDGELFGRDERLGELDVVWDEQQCHVLTLVAWGGVGKTALVNGWLNRMEEDNWRGARRVYGWSFYSQGTDEKRQASGDEFINDALEWFGDPNPEKGTTAQKSRRLAELIRGKKTLLVLDGMEPLQYPPGPMAGKIKDDGVAAVVRELSRGINGLCVITTREEVDDLKGRGDAVKKIALENLSPEAGAVLLDSLGVKGTDKEYRETSKEFGGHALALRLLGNYLAVVHSGEIRKRDLVPRLTDDEKKGGHAKRVMESYEVWLTGRAELDVLYLMGLFDRPAEGGAIAVLRAEPVIERLTEKAAGLNDAKWEYAVKRLRDVGLLAKEEKGREGDLDCHPLVREHFGEKLEVDRPGAWGEAHGRLYEYYKGVPEKERPDTLEEMEPLFRAVYHGCAAGRHEETFNEVHWERINRGNEYFVMKQLGAFGSWLGAVACFFEEVWGRPAGGLSEQRKAIVLNHAGLALRAVGRLGEATEPFEACLELRVKQGVWASAAINASNVSELYLTLGEVGKAVEYGRRCVEYADKSGDEFHRRSKRTTLADALHQAGEVEEVRGLFAEAERMQQEEQPEYRYLYSLQGYQYCDLLLGEGKTGEVKERGQWCIETTTEQEGLLDIALYKLSIGRALLAEAAEKIKAQNAKGKSVEKSLHEAKRWLDEAVDGLRKAGQQWFLPAGLLARAGYWRVAGDYGKAVGDLDEVREIAERGGMRLFLADYHLERARLARSRKDNKKMAEHQEAAKGLIEACGYHRRVSELESLRDGA